MNKPEVVVIGGGISGLACAKRLAASGLRDFLLITKDIGGRICNSQDGNVNYGAYYVRRDYLNARQHVMLKRRLRSSCIFVFHKNKLQPVTRSLIRHPFAMARLWFLIKGFDRRYQRLRQCSEFASQREVIEGDSLMSLLYQEDAVEFLHRYKLGVLKDCLINPIVWSTALVDVCEVSAATMMFLLLIIIHPTFEFEFQAEKMTVAFADNIEHDEVITIERDGDLWRLQTRRNRSYLARKLVMATPIDTTKKLLHNTLPQLDFETNKPVCAHMVHVRGTLRHPFRRARYVALAPQKREIVLAQQEDGTHLLYSRNKEINFDEYFSEHQVVGRKTWNPAFWVGKQLIESRIRDDLYLIGDHSVTNMEDAFLTGVYAGNQLARKASPLSLHKSSRPQDWT